MKIISLLALTLSFPAFASSTFKLRDYEVQKLDNGLKIIWIKDDKLPVLSLAMSIHAGGSIDPKGKEGLADATVQLLDKGVGKLNAIEIAERLEQRADTFGGGVDADATHVGIRGLSFHRQESLDDYFRLITEPTFPEAELERHRKRVKSRLSRLVDQPSAFTDVVFAHSVYGEHPYFHDGHATSAGIAAIKREDIVAFHKKYYAPKYATLAVVGQFDDEFKKEVIKKMSSWKNSEGDLPSVGKPDVGPSGIKILAVEKSGVQQAEIRFGHLGPKRDIPDHVALKVANSILGEPASFSARLFNEIRIKRGLTYSVRSMFDQRLLDGVFQISTFTRTDKILEMIKEVSTVLKTFVDKGVTKEEVETAKSALKGRFPRLVETSDDLAAQLLLLDLYGVSFDYLKNFTREVDKIKASDVNSVIKKYYHPDRLRIVVFGPVLNHDMAALPEIAPTETKNFKDVQP